MSTQPQFVFGVPNMGRPTPRKNVELEFRQSEPHLLERVKFADIQENQCHWVYGTATNCTMCGRPVQSLSSYCPEHHSRVFFKGSPVKL